MARACVHSQIVQIMRDQVSFLHRGETFSMLHWTKVEVKPDLICFHPILYSDDDNDDKYFFYTFIHLLSFLHHKVWYNIRLLDVYTVYS